MLDIDEIVSRVHVPAGSTKIVSWFSCGAASAVALYLFKAAFELQSVSQHSLRAVRCYVANEHADNERFSNEVQIWVGLPIEVRRSSEYQDCWDVWERRKYLAGRYGAPCTIELKKAVRWELEKEWQPTHQIFGFTAEESSRAERFKQQNPDVNLLTPLIDAGITKQKCFEILKQASIDLPAMYKMGYNNNNCIGCVKGGAGYWNKIRKDFPDVFDRMVNLEEKLGASLVQVKGKRIKLKELPPGAGRLKDFNIDCGILCENPNLTKGEN